MADLDKFDQKILELLVEDARQSVSAIARVVNLSRSAVTGRIARLEQQGVITGYHAHLERAQNAPVQAYIELTFERNCFDERCRDRARRIRTIPEVRMCHTITGAVDMMLFVEAPTMTRLAEICRQLEHFPGISHLQTHSILDEMFNDKF